MRLVVGISGASGAIYGIRALEALRNAEVETHLILTSAARETIRIETDRSAADVEGLATETYRIDDPTAKISSGSFRTDGMVVIPCSMKTLGGVASGYADNLLLRAAEVTMKERRPLVLVVRETPLTLIDLENMVKVARAGVHGVAGHACLPQQAEDDRRHSKSRRGEGLRRSRCPARPHPALGWASAPHRVGAVLRRRNSGGLWNLA